MSWTDLYRRVGNAERRVPRPPDRDGPVDFSEIFTAAECMRFADIRERYPTCMFAPDDLWMVADDDLEFLAATAERVKRGRDAQEVATETT